MASPKPVPYVLTMQARVDLPERLEQRRQVLFPHADARVGYAQARGAHGLAGATGVEVVYQPDRERYLATFG